MKKLIYRSVPTEARSGRRFKESKPLINVFIDECPLRRAVNSRTRSEDRGSE
jgi:hypothetical protein